MNTPDLWLQDIIEDILIIKMYKILKENHTISSEDRIVSARIFVFSLGRTYQISVTINPHFSFCFDYNYERIFTKQELILFLMED